MSCLLIFAPLRGRLFLIGELLDFSLQLLDIWRRALGEGEIRALYLRGALRLAFQVRTCADLACWHASPFVGPANSLTAFFVDESDGSHAEVQASLSGMESSRFIQFRTVLSSDALPPLWEGPRVRSVTLAPLGQD